MYYVKSGIQKYTKGAHSGLSESINI